MSDAVPVPTDTDAVVAVDAGGPTLTWGRVVALVVAVAFLGGAIGWAIGQRRVDPFSATDVGFMQDMGLHHEQAIQMSILLLDKEGIDDDLRSFAIEYLVGQRYEQGIFNGLLDRFGHSSDPGDTVMGWMGPPVPADQMEGLATDAQMADLRAATGTEAESLFIALMSEHHLGGLHMADEEARKGHDKTVRNLALAMVKTQRGEVIDLDRYRRNHDLPIPAGFTDPMDDQRLNPLSITGD